MLPRLLYFATTFVEATLSVFGIRGLYEQPAYTLRQVLPGQIEIRDYAPRMAVETAISGKDREAAASAAFQRLFAYITGANSAGRTVAMTAPVEQGRAGADGALIAMTIPVQTGPGDGADTMRFFLPRAVIRQGPPAPKDPAVRLVTLPAMTVAARRFSGLPDGPGRPAATRDLLQGLAHAGWQPQGPPFLLTYDPPFTPPFLRRNEVAVAVQPR